MQAMIPTFFALYMSRDIDLADPHNLFALRALFLVSTLLQALVGLLVFLRVRAAADRRPVNMPAAGGAPASVFTVEEFDRKQVRTYLQAILTNTAMMAFFHLKLEASVPVYFQIFMGLFRVWDWEMFRIHFLGESFADFPALARPFPQPPNPFASLMSSFNSPEEPAAPEAGAIAAGGGAAAPRVEVMDEEEEDKKTK